MPIADTFENEAMLLFFNNTNIALIGDATGVRGSTVAGSLFIALHTADPGDAGSQVTSEATYTSYGRATVARSAGGFTITANAVANAAAVTFVACTGGSNTITHFSVGVAVSGASKILWYGALNASLVVSNGITPSYAIGQLACDIT